MHGAQLLLQGTFAARAVGVQPRHACAGQQRGQLFLQLLGAAPERARSRLPQSGQARGTRSVRPQWWQRSVRSALWKTRQALQCGQPLFQPQAPQCSTGA